MAFEGPSSGQLAKTETAADRLERAYSTSMQYLGDSAVKLNQHDLSPYYDESRVQTFLGAKDYDANPDVAKKYSRFQEAVTHYGVKEADWFGSRYDAVKRSEYDDTHNGTDLVTVVRGDMVDGVQPIKAKLAIDLTTGETDFEKKMEDIVYKMHRYPESLYCQFFADFPSATGGKQDIPRVVMQYSQEALDGLMEPWRDRAAGRHALAENPMPSRLLTQALFQSAVFKRLTCVKEGANYEWRKQYAQNEVYLRHALVQKIKARKSLPTTAAEETLDTLSHVMRMRNDQVRELVCPKSDTASPTILRLVWGV
jgi:hypothetical protein